MEMPEDLEPLYSNLARISHTPAEIIVDFSRMLPAQATFKVLARVILSPIGAKFLLRALGENIARYEADFGEIQLPGESGLAGRPVQTGTPAQTTGRELSYAGI